jgi:hypothetical protein
MKTYTRRRGRCRRQTRSKKYLNTRRQRSRYGGVSKRPSATPTPTPSKKPSLGIRQSSRTRGPPPPPPPPPPPSKAPSRSAKPTGGVVVIRNGVSVSQSRGRTPSRAPSRAPPKTLLTNAGISKKEISKDDKDDAEVSEAVRIIANFPKDMDKFLQMVINNYKLLNDENVKFALRQQISINMVPATGRLSRNGIIFISYICGILRGLLDAMTAETNVDKKSEILHKIKQIEHFICLLDSVGCSWGIRPYNKIDMETIDNYYRIVKDDEAGLQEYYHQLNALVDTYFPVLKKHANPSHVVSSSMCRRLIPGHVVCHLPILYE